MSFSEIIGWVGFGLLVIAWVPQTWDTIKSGKTEMNLGFIILYVVSSGLLTLNSYLEGLTIYLTLNALLTFGSGINLYYKFFPRKSDG